jgi:hypothetical protein
MNNRAGVFPLMTHDQTSAIRKSYDQIADEYARRIYRELEGKPFDRKLLSRFAGEVSGLGEVCDMGCGSVLLFFRLSSRRK